MAECVFWLLFIWYYRSDGVLFLYVIRYAEKADNKKVTGYCRLMLLLYYLSSTVVGTSCKLKCMKKRFCEIKKLFSKQVGS